jgi:hypothetical protein
VLGCLFRSDASSAPGILIGPPPEPACMHWGFAGSEAV